MTNKITYLFGEPKPLVHEGKKQPYKAVNAVKESHPTRYDAFTIFYEDGSIAEIVYYNYVIRVITVDPTKLAIMSTEGVYLINGQHLDRLLPALKERHLDYMRGYCETLHLKPNPDAVFIELIDYLTNQEWQRFTNRDEIHQEIRTEPTKE